MRRGTIMADAVSWILFSIGIAVIVSTTANAAPQARSSQNLFPPSIARELDATITSIIRQDNLPSVAVRPRFPTGAAMFSWVASRIWKRRRAGELASRFELPASPSLIGEIRVVSPHLVRRSSDRPRQQICNPLLQDTVRR
jgi:hypothetical protein